MRLRDGLDDRETEAGATVRAGAVKSVEDER